MAKKTPKSTTALGSDDRIIKNLQFPSRKFYKQMYASNTPKSLPKFNKSIPFPLYRIVAVSANIEVVNTMVNPKDIPYKSLTTLTVKKS